MQVHLFFSLDNEFSLAASLALRLICFPQDPQCLPGCACNPLQAYVTSCALSKCSVMDKHPSRMHHHSMIEVDSSTGSTLILPQSAANCDPILAGEACGYFVAVTARLDAAYDDDMREWMQSAPPQQASFTILAHTPYDINLVPCDISAAPDGECGLPILSISHSFLDDLSKQSE